MAGSSRYRPSPPRCPASSIRLSAFGSPGLLARGHHPALLHDPAAHGDRQRHLRVVRRHRLVLLAHLPVPEQRLVRAPVPGPYDEQRQPRRQPVEPVRGLKRGQRQIAPQPGQRGLGDVPPARSRGEEVRFVGDHDPLVTVDDPHLERHRHLRREVPVEPDIPPRLVRLTPAQRPARPDEPPGTQHRVHPLAPRSPPGTGPPDDPGPSPHAPSGSAGSRTRTGSIPSRWGSGAGGRPGICVSPGKKTPARPRRAMRGPGRGTRPARTRERGVITGTAEVRRPGCRTPPATGNAKGAG